MLSGEILSRTPLSVALLPPPSLIRLCKIMATIASMADQSTTIDDDMYLGESHTHKLVFTSGFMYHLRSITLDNGLLSYENPNYHMYAQRIERNSHLYEEILCELKQKEQKTVDKMSPVCNSADMQVPVVQQNPRNASSRKEYARLDVCTMGVNLNEKFM